VKVARGDRVPRGQVLVRLDPTLAEAEVAHTEATLAAARTALLIATHDLERATGLRRARIASLQDLERAQLTHDEATARRREAEARLDSARKRRADLEIASPVAGTVDQIPFDAGERVPAGGVVVVVLDDALPWARIWIPERAAGHVHPGTRARVHIDGLAQPVHGRILDVAREAEFTPHFALTERDRVHLVYEARVRLEDAPPTLRPGIPAEVTLLPEPPETR
jgi:RND family efflux transporter MFP subunit